MSGTRRLLTWGVWILAAILVALMVLVAFVMTALAFEDGTPPTGDLLRVGGVWAGVLAVAAIILIAVGRARRVARGEGRRRSPAENPGGGPPAW